MSLPIACPRCGKEQWALGQEIVPPAISFMAPNVWHRRTTCRWCDATHVELRNGGLWAITTRTDPIDPRGTNPFLTAERSEDAS